MNVTVEPATRVAGSLRVPGDKSIGHRALLLAARAAGRSRVRNLSAGADVRSTRACLEQLGVSIRDVAEDTIDIDGTREFLTPRADLDCGNSGTTMRLLAGMLAAQPIDATLTGDRSLRGRPMRRVADPLRAMGAGVELADGGVAPMHVRGSAALSAIDYQLPVASAQLKSALLLAGLGAHGRTTLGGALAGRDHTERMMPAFGIELIHANGTLAIEGGQRLHAAAVDVPGDVSMPPFGLPRPRSCRARAWRSAASGSIRPGSVSWTPYAGWARTSSYKSRAKTRSRRGR